jgi:type IV pilus assembly protein PilY1
MYTRWIIVLSLCTSLAWPGGSFADDTDIYGSTNTVIQPNVLIIFDNSGSMNDDIALTPDPYDPATDYSSSGSYNKNAVYRQSSGSWSLYINNVEPMSCLAAHTALTTSGSYTGKLASNGTCGTKSRTTALGNYLNYLNGPGATSKPKLEIAKDVIKNIVTNTDGVRFGLMNFGSWKPAGNYKNDQGGHIVKDIKDMAIGTNKQDLLNAIKNIVADTWTPLAEVLYEAGLYFKGAASYFNAGVTYTSPIQYSCQKNYIILMTDGLSTHDQDPILASAVGDTDNNLKDPGSYPDSGSHWLDDVAKKWYDEDLLPSSNVSGSGKQNIITYTIGFSTGDPVANQLLADTAANGKGQAFTADNAQQLTQAFLTALGQIIEDNTSFVAPVVPVSPENRTYSGDYVYIGFFRPNTDAFWSGNIKKYKILGGQIVDKNGNVATNPDGSFIETSVSYWSSTADGGRVEKGGVGEGMLSMTLNPTDFDPAAIGVRKIYTYFGTDAVLKNAANQFEIANASVTPTVLGLSASDTAGKDQLIKFVHGQDAYNNTTTTRDWILGDVLHSGPAVVAYSITRSVIYVGSNDGMLHAFDDTNGQELWSYIPQDQLPYLKNLNGTIHPYSVDGSPKAYIFDHNKNGIIGDDASDKVILVFGERRGGTTYHAIDVTNPDDPRFLWDIQRGDSGLTELGQTWSAPLIKKVKLNSGVKNVFFVGGGYDPVNEDVQPPTTDAEGRSIYAIEVETGNRIWSYSVSNNAAMTYAIPSDVTTLDTNRDGYVDQLYVGDVGGQMWRFDLSDPNVGNWSGRVLFRSNSGGSHRKILYRPDLTREATYYMLFFGTGDREHPLDNTALCNADGTGNCDRIYGVKDVDGSTAVLNESNLVNVTIDDLQVTASASQVTNDLNDLAAMSGWFIALNAFDPGEKVVSAATLFNKVVSIATFQPTTSGTPDPCLADVGIGRVYEVNYLTGESVFNYYAANDSGYSSETNARAKGGTGEVLKREDRVKTVGAGIPSQVVMVIPESGTGTCDVMAIAGIGGGVAGLNAKCGGTTQRLFWRELFQ